MQILFTSSDFNQNQNAKLWVVEFITNSIEEYLGNDVKIDQIVIADEKNFGDEIHKIQTLYGMQNCFTDNNENTAVAKAITNTDNISSIVFRDFIFGGIYGECAMSQNFNEWDQSVQLFYYVIFHELSHCYDDIKRTSHHSEQKFKRSSFSVSQIREHFIGVLFSEFAACTLSRQKMSKSVFEQEINNTVDSCNSQIADLYINKENFLINNIGKVDIAYQVSQLSWLVIVQFSKLVGSDINNERNFSLEQISSLLHTKESLANIFIKFHKELSDLWEIYPSWSADSDKPFFDIWKELIEIFGFTFNGDSIDTLIIEK